MDELSLQSQQLQKEFEAINKRKKGKKSTLPQNSGPLPDYHHHS